MDSPRNSFQQNGGVQGIHAPVHCVAATELLGSHGHRMREDLLTIRRLNRTAARERHDHSGESGNLKTLGSGLKQTPNCLFVQYTLLSPLFPTDFSPHGPERSAEEADSKPREAKGNAERHESPWRHRVNTRYFGISSDSKPRKEEEETKSAHRGGRESAAEVKVGTGKRALSPADDSTVCSRKL